MSDQEETTVPQLVRVNSLDERPVGASALVCNISTPTHPS